MLQNVAVIQGDGIDYAVIKKILAAVDNAGFSPENVAFGMGGGLLQKVNRDTLSFATKLCYIETIGEDGKTITKRNVMKSPSTDVEKRSLPGLMMVLHSDTSHHVVYTSEQALILLQQPLSKFKNSMVTVYDKGVLDNTYMKESFKNIRARLDAEWSKCQPKAKRGEYPLSQSIVALQDQTAAAIKKRIDDSSNAAVGENAKRNTTNEKLIADEDLALAKEDCTPVKMAEIQAIKKGRVDRKMFVDQAQTEIDKRSRTIAGIKEEEAQLGVSEAGKKTDSSMIQSTDDTVNQMKENLANAIQITEKLKVKATARIAEGTGVVAKSQYPDSELEYPLMRLNALLDNISSKLDK